VGWLLSRSGRSYAEEHLRLQPSPHTYNHEDDVLPTRNFGGVLGSYPRGRLYLGLPIQKEVCYIGRRVFIGNCYRYSLRPIRAHHVTRKLKQKSTHLKTFVKETLPYNNTACIRKELHSNLKQGDRLSRFYSEQAVTFWKSSSIRQRWHPRESFPVHHSSVLPSDATWSRYTNPRAENEVSHTAIRYSSADSPTLKVPNDSAKHCSDTPVAQLWVQTTKSPQLV
jgi:hypothetical protein